MKEWLNRMKEDGTTGLEHGGTKLKHGTSTTGVHSFDKAPLPTGVCIPLT